MAPPLAMSDGDSRDGEFEEAVWDPGWDPLIGFLDRPSPKSMPPVQKSFGPINVPKRKSDQEKLRGLFEICRGGNIREARTALFHMPYLLEYTDKYGFTALHHAQLSRNAEFYAELLKLFNNPRTFQKKLVQYDGIEALRSDGLVLHRELDFDRPDGGLVTVQQVRPGSLAEWNGVVVGDHIKAIFTEALCEKSTKKIMQEMMSIISLDRIPGGAEANFPLAFDFRGPALREILAEGMAALQNANKKPDARKQKKLEKRASIVGPGWEKVVKPQPQPGETQPPKSAHPHDEVLPTLLVREKKRKKV
jgi:hypothetical protein